MTAETIRLHPELSDRQRRILDYVTSTITRDDRSPSLREIGDACDVSSTSVVSYNVDQLLKRGLLLRVGDPYENRNLRLPVNPWRQLVEDADYIFGCLDGFGLPVGVESNIAAFRQQRAKLIRG